MKSDGSYPCFFPRIHVALSLLKGLLISYMNDTHIFAD
ncbi:hypothetical protein ACVKSX_002947 [Pantoea sp. PvP021]